YGIQHYIYSPTSLYPHKNNDLLIKAFLKLKKTKKLPHKLIITGIDPFNKAGWLKSLIHKYNLDNEVFYFGWISREYIPFFYKGADLVVYLSSYEGFGLPVLEAMASGCPILASNRGSLPEVVAQAGITVDPENIRDVSLKMYDLLINKAIREYYINKGFSRVKKFSWEGVAKRVIKIYSSL
ncbi:MAG: glycosyltransferase, partial [Candidatus Aminicenantes bacterium]|nr:glycosyltransferase [Candidatus Aminicenantes bacterium]